MLTYLRQKLDERTALTQMATDVAERAAADGRDLTDSEQTDLAQWAQRTASLDDQIGKLNAQVESTRAFATLQDKLNTTDVPTVPERRSAQPEVEVDRGWGEAFIESDAFKNYPGAGSSQRVAVPTGLETRAAIAVGTYPAGILTPTNVPVQVPQYITPLLDVISKVTVGSNAVQWVKWSPNPQAAASVVAEGELKPEATMTPSVTSDTLDTYAHWKAITRQALEDIPQIRQIVEGRLRQGLMVALEQAVTASLVAATIPAAGGGSGTSLLESIRLGMATVQVAGYRPNAILLDPVDWATLDTEIMGGTLGGPSVNPTFWGMRPIAVPALTAGTAYVGDFSAGVTLYSRSTTDVYLTDSHSDYFIRNIQLILAELRALATVPEPAAIAKCVAVA